VPNAAVSTHVGMTLDMTALQFDKMFDVNVRGPFLLIKEALPLLQVPLIQVNQKTKNSNVVIISSIGGYELEPGLGFYSVTKTSLIALTKVLSKELIGDNIRVNAIAPVPTNCLIIGNHQDQI
jgi:dehydrogenase/reductase SDR family protein 4